VAIVQIQAFPQANVFGAVFNHVGFFTVEIWTGILLMGIVVVMLVFAIDMTYSIQTTDRFDNPNEKNMQFTTN